MPGAAEPESRARAATDSRLSSLEGRDWVRDVLAVLSVVAVLIAGVLGLWWWITANDQNLHFALTRNAVLEQAKKDLVQLNSLDYRDADRAMDRWREAATGSLLDEFNRDRGSDANRIRTAQVVSTAKPVEAAVTRLDTRAGTANVIAVLEVTVAQNGGSPSIRRSRLDVDLARTPQGWKVGALRVVDVVG